MILSNSVPLALPLFPVRIPEEFWSSLFVSSWLYCLFFLESLYFYVIFFFVVRWIECYIGISECPSVGSHYFDTNSNTLELVLRERHERNSIPRTTSWSQTPVSCYDYLLSGSEESYIEAGQWFTHWDGSTFEPHEEVYTLPLMLPFQSLYVNINSGWGCLHWVSSTYPLKERILVGIFLEL